MQFLGIFLKFWIVMSISKGLDFPRTKSFTSEITGATSLTLGLDLRYSWNIPFCSHRKGEERRKIDRTLYKILLPQEELLKETNIVAKDLVVGVRAMTSKWTECTERALEKETSDGPLYPETKRLRRARVGGSAALASVRWNSEIPDQFWCHQGMESPWDCTYQLQKIQLDHSWHRRMRKERNKKDKEKQPNPPNGIVRAAPIPSLLERIMKSSLYPWVQSWSSRFRRSSFETETPQVDVKRPDLVPFNLSVVLDATSPSIWEPTFLLITTKERISSIHLFIPSWLCIRSSYLLPSYWCYQYLNRR